MIRSADPVYNAEVTVRLQYPGDTLHDQCARVLSAQF